MNSGAPLGDDNLTIPRLREFIDAIEDDYTLNLLFYHSLFDYSAVWDHEWFPFKLINEQRTELQDLLCEVCGTDKFRTHTAFYKQFEDTILNPDPLCKIILSKQLSASGLEVKPNMNAGFDLIIEDKNIHVELKRVLAWGSYAEYFDEFYGKTQILGKYIYTVLTTHPPKIREIFTQLQTREAEILDEYIKKIISAHYTLEKLLKRQRLRKIQFVVASISKDNKDHIDSGEKKDIGNLRYAAEQIKLKIREFEVSQD